MITLFGRAFYLKIDFADHSRVVLSGFVATGERWLSAFMDGHIMGLRLTENDHISSKWGASESYLK